MSELYHPDDLTEDEKRAIRTAARLATGFAAAGIAAAELVRYVRNREPDVITLEDGKDSDEGISNQS